MDVSPPATLKQAHRGDVLYSSIIKGVFESYKVYTPEVKMIEAEDGQLYYEVIEPELNEAQKKTYVNAMKSLFYTLKPTDVDKVVTAFLDYVGYDKAIGYYVIRDLMKYDVLTVPMEDDEVEDISYSPVYTGGTPVYIFHREFGNWIPSNIVLDKDQADKIVQKIAFKSGKSITLARPILDAMTPEGYRIALTFGREVSPLGSTISIRKPLRDVWTLPYLAVERKIMPAMVASALWYVLENRGVILVVGRSGTGKTTLINALLTVVPPSWKIVTVEEIPELRVIHPNWIRLVARKPTLMTEYNESAEIPMDRLISHTFRIRPDIVSVGEVRGKEEIREFIHSVAAGHGGITSLHAEDFFSLKARFNYSGVDDSFFAIVSLIIFVNSYNVKGRLVRRVQEVGEVVLENGVASYVPLARYNPLLDSYWVNLFNSKRLQHLASLKGLDQEELKKELEKRSKFMLKTYKLPSHEFAKAIRAFYEEGVV
jgi:flagellar protein FlaI